MKSIYSPIKDIPKPSKKELEQLYFQENKSLNEIAVIFQRASCTISNWFKDYQIIIDTHRAIRISKPSKKELEQLYFQENKSLLDIGKIYNCSNTTIKKWFITYGIKLKSHSESIQLAMNKYSTRFKNQHGFYPQQKDIPKQSLLILNSPEKLKNCLLEYNLNRYMVAKKLSVSPSYVDKKLQEYGLEKEIRQKGTSNFEKDVLEYIKQIYPYDIQINQKGLFSNSPHLEIDIYIPKIRFGIECNGVYWHSDCFKNRLYHQRKSIEMEKNNIQLFHIWEWEWNNPIKQIIIKDRLKYYLDFLSIKKIDARKCLIREINYKEKHQFLERTHLQGDVVSKYNYGLFYQNELVCCMTFGSSKRFYSKSSQQYEYELLRFSSENGVRIVGGFSKLFKYFLKQKNAKTVLSFSHIHHSVGQVYRSNNFIFQRITKPSYVWVKGNEILSRYQVQKHKNKNQSNISETDIMKNQGYYRIWDCGNKVWVYENK